MGSKWMNRVSSVKNVSKLPRTLLLLVLVLSASVIGVVAAPVYAKGNGHGGNGNGNGHGNGNSHGNNVNTASSVGATKNLVSLVNGMQLSKGTTSSLNAKLNAAIDALGRGQTTAAKNMLNAFINEVNAQCCNTNGKPLTSQQANQLTTVAQQVIQSIG